MRSSIEIQRLRELPIEGVAKRLGLKVERHKCLCPFHDDHHASLSLSVSRNTYRCFACGAHGGVIDLAMALLPPGGGRESAFLKACKWLAEDTPLATTSYRHNDKTTPKKPPFDASRYARYFEHPWLSPEACKFLFERRHLHPAVVKYCRLNSFRDWLQIPYYNQEGKLVGIQRRYMGNDPAFPRFRFPQGSECSIYNLPVLKMLRQGEDLYITEGCSDCWAMLSAGHKSIAIPSATLLKRQELRHELTSAHIPDMDITLHIYPDNDAAGESLYRQLLTTANDAGLCLVRHELPDGCKDFSDYWTAQA
jgi:DNA primase